MGAGRVTLNEESLGAEAAPPNDEALLDAALQHADHRLVASLQAEELHRRRRRYILGGVAMSMIIAAVASGLILAGVGAARAPVVVKTVPESGAKDVNPRLPQIRVTFDQNMTVGRNYSWVGGGPTFPKTRGEPQWINKRTCAVPVALEPGHEYWLSINSDKFTNFRSEAGTPAVPYPISFSTTGAKEPAEQKPGEVSLGDVERAASLSSDGWELWKVREYHQAAAKFEQAVKVDPESTNAWNGLGWSRFNGGESLAAEEAFKACLELEEAHSAGQNGLGQVYLLQRRYEKAETHLLKAAELQASAAWYGLTRLYLLEGK